MSKFDLFASLKQAIASLENAEEAGEETELLSTEDQEWLASVREELTEMLDSYDELRTYV